MERQNDRTEYLLRYAKEKLKRIPLDVKKEKYDQIKAAAEHSGESVNGYIKAAIDSRMRSEGFEEPPVDGTE